MTVIFSKINFDDYNITWAYTLTLWNFWTAQEALPGTDPIVLGWHLRPPQQSPGSCAEPRWVAGWHGGTHPRLPLQLSVASLPGSGAPCRETGSVGHAQCSAAYLAGVEASMAPSAFSDAHLQGPWQRPQILGSGLCRGAQTRGSGEWSLHFKWILSYSGYISKFFK